MFPLYLHGISKTIGVYLAAVNLKFYPARIPWGDCICSKESTVYSHLLTSYATYFNCLHIHLNPKYLWNHYIFLFIMRHHECHPTILRSHLVIPYSDDLEFLYTYVVMRLIFLIPPCSSMNDKTVVLNGCLSFNEIYNDKSTAPPRTRILLLLHFVDAPVKALR